MTNIFTLSITLLPLLFLPACKKEENTVPEVPKDYVSQTCEIHGDQLYKKAISAHIDCTKEYWQFLMCRDWDKTHPHAIRDFNGYDITENERHYHLVCEHCETSFEQEHKAFDPNKNGFRLKLELQENGYFATESGDIFYTDIGPVLSQAREKQPWVHLFIRTNISTPPRFIDELNQIARKAGIKLISCHYYDREDELSQ